MARIRHISFLGFWLLLSSLAAFWLINFYQEADFGKRITTKKWQRPADVGADFNQQFLQDLAREENPILKAFGDIKFC